MAQINLENLPEIINNKMDRDGNNASDSFDCVVESYGPDSSGNWYRVYKSGWIEQGGISETIPGDGSLTITLLKIMNDTNYFVSLTNSNFRISQAPGLNVKNTTSISVDYKDATLTGTVHWEVKGMGA